MYGFSGWLVVFAVLSKTPSVGAGTAETYKPAHFLQRHEGVTARHEQHKKIADETRSVKADTAVNYPVDEDRDPVLGSKLVPVRFLQSHGTRSVQADPVGYHFDESSKSEADADGDRSIWYGESKANEFRFLDNLNPVAPYDDIADSNNMGSISEAPGKDSARGALFVPQYIIPDGFPAVEGSECMCQIPEQPGANVKCDCPMAKRGANHLEVFHWAVEEPVPGTNNFSVKPADVTFSDGDYWRPSIKDGLVAPEDRLPIENYPVQALGDHLKRASLPVAAQEDVISRRFARYIDQVEARKRQCDTVSENCTTPCSPGDRVVAKIGNTGFDATIVSTLIGNAMVIQFVPSMALTSPAWIDCTLQASCTIFRFCIDGRNQCTEAEDKVTRDSFGNVHDHHECPEGTAVCKSVHQVVSGTTLTKTGKACKAIPGEPDPYGSLR